MVKSVTVRAPCSTANLGPGFDVFGLALDAFYDEVTVTKKGKGITIVSSDDIPLDPKKNTAGIVAKAMLDNFRKEGWTKYKNGIEIKIKKGVPAGYGLGSSAASAAACALGMESLFKTEKKWGARESRAYDLVYYAGLGEKASAGTVHYDNVAASLFGNFVIVNPNFLNHKYKVPVTTLDVEIDIVIGIPKIKVPKQKTKASRGVIPKTVKFSDASFNLANATMFVAKGGGNPSTFTYLRDAIVEPARKKMIPGFDQVKENAMKAGAIAFVISGAGPSVIAFSNYYKKGGVTAPKKIGAAMKKGFKSAKVDCDIVICKPSNGPKIVKIVK
jgi:homoserine kinase